MSGGPRSVAARAALVVAAAAAFAALGAAAPPAGPGAAPPVAGWTVRRGPFKKILVLGGRLSAARAERLRVPVLSSWRTTVKWLVDEGAQVQAGDPVATLDTTSQASDLAELQNQLSNKRQERALREADGRRERLEAQIQLEQARVEFEKAKIDAAVPAVVRKTREKQEFDLAQERAQTRLRQAETTLATQEAKLDADLKRLDVEAAAIEDRYERDRKELEAATVRTSRPGVVVYEEHEWLGRKVRVGDSLQSTMPLVQIPDLESLEVEAFAPESEGGLLHVGQQAALSLDAFPAREFHGAIREIGQRAEERPEWGRAFYFRVTITLDRPDTAIMRPGMSVMCAVTVQELPDALLVPLQAAVYKDGALLVRPKGKAPLRLAPLSFNEFDIALAPDGKIEPGLALAPVDAGRP